MAQLERPRRRRGPLVAYLYLVERAKPVRPMTVRRAAALAKANTARRTCPTCRRDAGYVIPAALGMCVPCADTPHLAACTTGSSWRREA
ncbi:hypothetical protein EES37_09710 [Streptomyces sp. ADI91-18]|nr:hypothetical protein EES37_09710 [Streptomyces sp. ADI91-18]